MKRFVTLALVCAIALLMLSLAACRNEPAQPAVAPPAATPPAATPPAAPPPAVAPAPPATQIEAATDIGIDFSAGPHFATDTLTQWTLFSAFGGDGGPRGEYPFWQELARLTNMQMTNIANPNIADGSEALNEMLLSGQLADVIYVNRATLPPLILQGAFIPLNDLIAEHAPNIQRYFEVMPDVRAASTSPCGNIFAIIDTLNPIWGDGIGAYNIPTMMWFIRQDWLDILDMDIPETFDETVAVMRAFRHGDPNGTGVADTVPYFFRNRNLSGLYNLLGVPGDNAGWAVCPYDPNQIVWGRTHERYRDALRYLAQWYEEGLIDPEIFTRGGNARQELFAANLGGITVDWFESTSSMNVHGDILAAVPDFNLVAMLPPYDRFGVRQSPFVQHNVGNFAWGISSDADPALHIPLIRMMDFFFSETGSIMFTHGVYDKSFHLVDGNIVTSQEALEFTGGVPNYLRAIGLFAVGGRSPLDLGLLRARPYGEIAYAARRLYTDNAVVSPPLVLAPRTQEQEVIWATHMPDIESHWREFEQQVVFGQICVDEGWAAYIATLNALGLEQIYAIQRDAFARGRQ